MERPLWEYVANPARPLVIVKLYAPDADAVTRAHDPSPSWTATQLGLDADPMHGAKTTSTGVPSGPVRLSQAARPMATNGVMSATNDLRMNGFLVLRRSSSGRTRAVAD